MYKTLFIVFLMANLSALPAELKTHNTHISISNRLKATKKEVAE